MLKNVKGRNNMRPSAKQEPKPPALRLRESKSPPGTHTATPFHYFNRQQAQH